MKYFPSRSLARGVRLALLLATLSGVGTIARAADAIGSVISYQGQLTNGAGKPVADSTINVTFKIYDGTTVVLEKVVPVATVGGVFNAFVNVDGVVFDPSKSYELGITAPNQGEVKHPIAAVPVALNAKKADVATTAVTAQSADDTNKIKGTPVDATAPTEGQALVYDSLSAKWKPLTLPNSAANQAALLQYYPVRIGDYSDNGSPFAICFDGQYIWTTSSTALTVTKRRASDGITVGTYYGGPGTAICFDGEYIWTCGTSTVTKLRASDGNLVGSYYVDGFLRAICFDGENIWVGASSGDVTKLRASDGATVGTYDVGFRPNGLCFDGQNIWAAGSSGSAIKLRASDGATVGTYNFGSSALCICFDGQYIWTAGLNNVTKVRASDGTVVGTYPLSATAISMCFDGQNIWITNENNADISDSVTKVRATDGTIVGTYSVGGTPKGICFDGQYIWTANQGGNSVTKLSKGG